MEIPIPLIGWFYTLASMVAITGGVITMVSLRRASPAERTLARRNALTDYLMFAVWIAGLAGGGGVLMHKVWALYVLELFCYALIVMTCISIYNRYRDVQRHAQTEHVNWLAALGGFAMVGIPVVLIAYLTIATLRSESVRATFLP
ncbi:MAG TPA: hypothetical protein VJM53_02255 [Burkholderiales bacterium]|nr:hypothetical protein [Burkholderiales bacterium]